jgi:hypothetical protein
MTSPAWPPDRVEHALRYNQVHSRGVRASKIDANGCFVLTLVSTLEAILREAWAPFLRKHGRIAKLQRQT